MKIADLVKWVKDDPELAIEPLFGGGVIPYPLKDIETATVSFSAVLAWRVSNTKKGSAHNVLLACLGTDAFLMWCGDGFLEGALKKEKPEDRLNALEAARPDLRSEVVRALRSHSGALASMVSAGCNFWALRSKGDACKHCKKVMHLVATELGGDPFVTLTEAYDALSSSGTAAPAAGPSTAFDWRERLPFAVPILLQGDRGSGKTTDAFAFARSRSLPLVLLPGHEGIQALDFLGHYVPVESGGLVWKDGPLALAVRRAAKEKVVLVIDEMLRIPTRQLSVLLTALTPIAGEYLLPTGRMVRVVDGVGEEEVLSCPVCNLAVFATTNVGSGYAIDDIDPAIQERFIPIQRDTDERMLKSVLVGLVTARGWASTAADQLVSFYKAMLALVQSGSLNRSPTLRTLVRAVELAADEPELVHTLQLQALLWVDLDSTGRPDETQLKAVTGAIDATVKGKAHGRRGR